MHGGRQAEGLERHGVPQTPDTEHGYLKVKVKVFQKICTQEGNRYWSYLECPNINLRISPTRELERGDLSSTANHLRPVSCEETDSVGRVRLRTVEQGDGSPGVNQELMVVEDVTKEQ